MIPTKDTALYKFCLHVLSEYRAVTEHYHNLELQELLDDAVEELKLEAKETPDGTMVSFIIKE